MGFSNRGRDATVPEGAQIGLGVRTAAIRSVNIQGALTNTGNQLDLAIQGRGWFEVTTPNGDTVYTRDGAFNTNENGQLVTTDGYNVTPSILIPQTATAVTVSQTGLVTATLPGQTTPQQLGQLTIANFVNEAGLLALGGNYFQQTAASGSRRPVFRATPRSELSSRATSRLPTLIRSPRSPTSLRPSAPMK
jgi:flagellar basal-body rod protein FlgG